MEEMITTPTSYSLLSYVFIVLCFKIGTRHIDKSPSVQTQPPLKGFISVGVVDSLLNKHN